MANETLATNIAALMREAPAIARVKNLNLIKGLLSIVDVDYNTAEYVNFPIIGKASSSDVTEVAEGSTDATNFPILSPDKLVGYDRHQINAFLSEKTLRSSYGRLLAKVTDIFSTAIKAKLEDDIVSLASGFSQTVAGAGINLLFDHFTQAKQILHAQGVDVNNLVAVLSGKQVWGDKGISGFSVDADANSGVLGEEMKAMGFVSQVAGIPVLVSNEINQDVGGLGDAAGMIMSRDALGLHAFNLFSLEVDEIKRQDGVDVICKGKWGETELDNDKGVYLLTNVT
jgi:hypothetical protein